jgi:hypothetical protein
MISKLKGYDKYYCFDAKKFDSSIDPWLVDVAIRILRRQYVEGEGERYNAYWRFVKNSLVCGVIRRKDGIRMQKHVGTVSGHSHNTLVQSIITLIIGWTVIVHTQPGYSDVEYLRYATIEALGDDNLMALKKYGVQLKVEDYARHAMRIFGVDWSGKKSFATTRLLDRDVLDFKGVQFLGKYMRLEDLAVIGKEGLVPIPYRPTIETLERLYYPEYGLDSLADTYERALANYLDGAGNPETRLILDALLDYLEEKGARAPENWKVGTAMDIVKVYDGREFEVPPPMRIDYEHWLGFMIC